MAQITRAFSPLFLISLLLFSVAINTPRVHAQGFLVGPYNSFRAVGQFCCTNSGNCPGTPLVGVQVTLTCGNSFFTATVGQNTTATDGSYIITAPAPAGFGLTVGLVLPCVVKVRLPVSVAVCPPLSTLAGNLYVLLQSTGNTVNGTQNLQQVLIFNLPF